MAAVAFGALWLAAAFLVYLSRRPPEPEVGPQTLDLGPEPPAVANLLVNDWRVTGDALPATLVDLAARNVVDVEQRGPGVFYIRMRETPPEPLVAYEQRVLDHLRKLAHDGVVPAEALTTGAAAESARWRQRFENEVVADAQRRGLSRDVVDAPVFTALLALSAIPGAFAWALFEPGAGGMVVVAAGVLLGWIESRHRQRATPEGLAAASRWLGVRAELAENEVFPTHSPLTVELWSRLLAYGAALGVTGGASAPLPMGTESDTSAWSAHGGRWRPVRVAYPHRWPLGWGRAPMSGIVSGLGVVVAAGVVYLRFPAALADAFGVDLSGLALAAFVLLPGAGVVGGIVVATMAFADLGSTVERTGPVLRLRVFGGEQPRHYVAVDDGRSRTIRAWRVKPYQYTPLTQGQVVTVSATKYLGHVRWIMDAESSAA